MKKPPLRAVFCYRSFNAFVELGEELFQILPVGGDRLFDRLAVRERAAEAVHPGAQQDLRRVGVELQALGDQRILRDLCHSRIPPF